MPGIGSALVSRIRRLDPMVLLIVVSATVTRILAALTGLGTYTQVLNPRSASSDQYQLLDVHLLETHLVTSIWHLNMQPPLYNLAVGVVVHLPSSWQAAAAEVGLFICFVTICVATYLTMLELSVDRRVACGFTLVFVVANPAAIFYSSQLFYTEPTAALATLFCLLLVRAARAPSTSRVAIATSAGALLSLTNSSFQPIMLLLVVIALAVMVRAHLRSVLLGSLGPLLFVALWMIRGVLLFGVATTSSWLGMNMADMTTSVAKPSVVRSMVSSGQLSPLALTRPWGPLIVYRAAPATHGPAAVTATHKENGRLNFNNGGYIGVSNRFLKNDFKFIAHRPLSYARQVRTAGELWLVPAEQYPPFDLLRPSAIVSYEHLYAKVILLQPRSDGLAIVDWNVHHKGPAGTQLAISEILTWLVVLLGGPVVVVLWWKRRRPDAAALILVTFVAVEWLVTTSLVDVGENNRFSFELGTIPLSIAVAVASELVRRLRARRATGEDSSARAPTASETGRLPLGTSELP